VKLRDRQLGTGIIEIDELDIGPRLGHKLNARIDELWSDFIMDELDKLGIGMFGDLGAI
ncbi:16594_t:CDS:2, partial [Gigaspora rosea]